jgi:hypothetical protein
MVAGNFKTYEITIANGAAGELNLSDVVNGEKILKINPGTTSVRILITPESFTTNATAGSYLLANAENEFSLGGGLDRISLYNGSGGEAKVSISVLF